MKFSVLALATLVTLVFPSLVLADDESFDDDSAPPFESLTGCVLKIDGDLYDCEYAVFGDFPPESSADRPAPAYELVAQASSLDKNNGCDAVDDAVNGKVALLTRGMCPFSKKAINAQKAGAVAVIVGDTETDTDPVRMKGTGDEEPTDIIIIPSLMVSRSDYLTLVKGEGKGETVIESNVNQTHPLHEERALKNTFAFGRENGEFAMQLASYMVRMNWKETGRQMLKYAGTVSKDYNVHYSIGEYFHNVEEDIETGAFYFEASANGIVDVLVAKKTRALAQKKYEELMEKLVNIMGLVPERPTGVFDRMSEAKQWHMLNGLMRDLSDNRALGTPSLLTWARYVKEIGFSDLCLEILEGSWFTGHQMHADEAWNEMITNARNHVAEFVDNKQKKKSRGEGSSEL